MTISTSSVSLSSVPCGESASIQGIQGGNHLLTRLAALGFTPGTRVRVLQNHGHGPLIVILRDTRVALGRGEASRIAVKPLENGSDGRG